MLVVREWEMWENDTSPKGKLEMVREKVRALGGEKQEFVGFVGAFGSGAAGKMVEKERVWLSEMLFV